MKNIIKKRGIKGIAFSLVLSLIFFILIITGAFTNMNNFFMDSIFQKPKPTTKDIYIVAIDDESIQELGPYEKWNRGHYAQALNNLNTKNPAVIAFDVLFTGKSDTEFDNDLALAASSGNVVMGCELKFGQEFNNNGNEFTTEMTVKGVSNPYSALLNNVDTGYVNALLDSNDGVARKAIPIMEYDNNIYKSFSYTIYEKYCVKKGITPNTYNKNNAYRINYSEYDGNGYTILSFKDIYNGEAKYLQTINEDSIILIGAYASGLRDSYRTPIKSGMMYGVEIHANILDAYIKNDLVTDVNPILIAFISLILLILISYFIYKSHILYATISTIVYGGILIGLSLGLYASKLYYPVFDMILALIIIYVAYIAFKYGEELYNRYQTVNVFKKYVAPQVVDKALKDVNYKVNVGGERRHISVLFVDIRGFTPLSEGLEPEAVVSILNEYLTLTTNSIFEAGGTLDKFIGDATMAVFNSPFDLDDYLFKSVYAAWLIAKGSEEIDRIAMERFGKHVSFGIGVNCGYAVVGNIGSKNRIDYTAIGDTVNTASRLESNAKSGEILISEDLYNQVSDRVEAEFVGGLALKGKSAEVKAYRVINVKIDNNMEGE